MNSILEIPCQVSSELILLKQITFELTIITSNILEESCESEPHQHFPFKHLLKMSFDLIDFTLGQKASKMDTYQYV